MNKPEQRTADAFSGRCPLNKIPDGWTEFRQGLEVIEINIYDLFKYSK